MRIAVCDDSNIVSAFMENYISSLKIADVEYEVFSSGEDLIHFMEVEKYTFNIFLWTLKCQAGMELKYRLHP